MLPFVRSTNDSTLAGEKPETGKPRSHEGGRRLFTAETQRVQTKRKNKEFDWMGRAFLSVSIPSEVFAEK
jgi:hypothetical protein